MKIYTFHPENKKLFFYLLSTTPTPWHWCAQNNCEKCYENLEKYRKMYLVFI